MIQLKINFTTGNGMNVVFDTQVGDIIQSIRIL